MPLRKLKLLKVSEREKKKNKKNLASFPPQVSGVTYETQVLVAVEKQLFCWKEGVYKLPGLPSRSLFSAAGPRYPVGEGRVQGTN